MTSLRCPRCTFQMTAERVGASDVDFCRRCRGVFIERGEGSALLGRFGDFSSWAHSGGAMRVGEGRLRCPLGHGRLTVWRVDGADGASVEVDTCAVCSAVWLDAQEIERLKRAGAALVRPAPQRFGPDFRLNEPPPGDEKTGVGWYLFQLFTAMPVEVYNPRRNTPVVCLALIAACVAAFAVELASVMAGDTGFVTRYGAVAHELRAGRNLHSVVTHMFLHGGIVHLLGNMWFLWTFGDNVEDRVGRGRFLSLYLLFGVAGLALQMALTTNASAPLVGASGAIAGLMGAYVGLFPRAHLYQVLLFIRWRVPVWFYLGAWVVLNAVIGAAELQHAVPEGGVAWWAHVGGFAAGLIWALTVGRIYREASYR